jgi:phage gp36-like protein
MAYCTESNLIEAVSEAILIQLTDDEDTGSINSDVVDLCIAKADAYIDTYLRGNHTVPISPVTEDVKQISIDMTVFYLYARRRSDSVPEAILETVKMAKKMLKNIRDVEVLIDDDSSYANTAGFYQTNKATSDKTFTDTFLNGY